jgi:hypothetical protein
MNWIPEAEAAKKVGRKPRTLRNLVKKGLWDVAYSAPNGRTFFYDERGIEKVLLKFSSTHNKN